MNKKAAVTGHTQSLGQSFYSRLRAKGYDVHGFSRSTGYDLRDYSNVTRMLEEVHGFDLFINNAKPDFCQAQILYRLVRQGSIKTIISIGSAAVNDPPNWTDTYLLEYLTQKTALSHANRVLEPLSQSRLILVNPHHLQANCDDFVDGIIEKHGL